MVSGHREGSLRSGKILFNVTQCLSGTVNMDIYATGKALEKAGVVSGTDITTESALAKLFYLMGKPRTTSRSRPAWETTCKEKFPYNYCQLEII